MPHDFVVYDRCRPVLRRTPISPQARKMLMLSYQQMLDKSDVPWSIATPKSKTTDTEEQGVPSKYLATTIKTEAKQDQVDRCVEVEKNCFSPYLPSSREKDATILRLF